MSIKRIWHRVQPIGQIMKRKQRQREMADREKQFEVFLMKELRKLDKREDEDDEWTGKVWR